MKILLLTVLAAVFGMAAPRPASGPAAAAPPAAAPASATPKLRPPASDRAKIVATALREVGTQEKTGNNDGPVDKYLAAVGLSKTRNPYCAAFVYWVGKNAGLSRNPFPRSAWSPDFLPAGSTSKITTARPGDTFGIYFASKRRIAHTGLVRGWQGRYLWTLEANTSPGQSTGEADRNGDGVWSKLRDPRTIHRVKSWLP
jgi:hypothetical protein